MALGLCCQWLQEKVKKNGETVYENIIEERALQLGMYKDGKYSISRIMDTYHNNVDTNIKIVPTLVANKIKSFRLSSGLFPLFEFTHEMVKADNTLLLKLKKLGSLFKDAGIRVTCHPGQFCIINSDSDNIISNSIRELAYHAFIFDAMELEESPYYAINIHGGKRGNAEKLIASINALPKNIKNRLTLENDERCFSVKQLKFIHDNTGVPIVFDSHHHPFNPDSLDLHDACHLSIDTWKNCKPLQHLSNTEPGLENGSFADKRKHSNYIHTVPEVQLDLLQKDIVDVDIEAKMKNMAIFKIRKLYNLI